MAEEIKKVEVPPQAPAQGAPDQKLSEKPPEPPKPTGLDAVTPEDLKALYKRSPQMFADAEIVPKKEPPKEEPKKEDPKPPEQSAAPVYGGREIKLAKDVPVNAAVIEKYLAHAKTVGLSPEQVQAEIDFQSERYREAVAAAPKQKTPQEVQAEQDAANVAVLKADKNFGGTEEAFKANMEIARRAALKYGDAELMERLKTSDPVLVRHFLKLGKADAEDVTINGPNRTGVEGEQAEKGRQDALRKRFKNTPQMFPDSPPEQ